ncbi:MAG: hypothetical protein VX874_06200 [Pseudomonadota bacterium]|nr:hypothetical protein [Pseudomonadota bacterium]
MRGRGLRKVLGGTAALILGLGLVWLATPSDRADRPFSTAVAQTSPDPAPSDAKEMRMTDEELAAFEARWSTASEDVRTVARSIAEGDMPDPDLVSRLDPAVLSVGLHVPALDWSLDGRTVQYRASLLLQSVVSVNVEAARLLIEAGANPNDDHGRTLFLALSQKSRGTPQFMVFPDFEDTLPFVEMFLAAGADPNQPRAGFRAESPLAFAIKHKNLGAIEMLVNAGADPWVALAEPDGYVPRTPVSTLAVGSREPTAAEMLFRMARQDGFAPKDEADLFALQKDIGAVVTHVAEGSGPTARAEAWRLDIILALLGERLAKYDPEAPAWAEALRETLPRPDLDEDAGWFLAPNERHSPHDGPISVPLHGTEIWGP